MIADDYLKKKDKDFYKYEKEITENEKSFTIEYILNDSLIILGGGAEITISKDSCKIIGKKFYQ